MQIISDYQKRAQGLSKHVLNVIDLYHNKKIEGVGSWDPPQTILGKPDVSLNRVKQLIQIEEKVINGPFRFLIKSINKINFLIYYKNTFYFHKFDNEIIQ